MTTNRYTLFITVVLFSAFATAHSPVNGRGAPFSGKETALNFAPPDVVIPSDTTICEGEDAILEVTVNPNGANVSWSDGVIDGQPFIPPVGTNEYVLTISDVDTTIVDTVTVTVLPNHTIEPATNTTICEGEPVNIAPLALGGGATNIQLSGTLPSGLTVVVQSGTFTIQGTPTSTGVFNYFITTTGNACTPASTDGTITVNPQPAFELTSSGATLAQQICSGDSITPITFSTEGATDADFDGLPSGVTGTLENDQIVISGTPANSGEFNYTVSLTGPCGDADETGSIEINEAPSADAGTDQTLCADNPTVTLNGAVSNASGQVWSASDGGGTFSDPDAAATDFEPAQSQLTAGSIFLVLTTVGAAAGCENATDSILVSFTEPFTAEFSYNGPFCSDLDAEIIPNFNGTEGGAFSSAVAAIDPSTGAFNPSVDGAGIFEITYTVPDSGGCPQFDTTHVITVNPALQNVSAGSYPDIALCNEASFSLSGNADNAAGIQWSASVAGGSFDNPDAVDTDFSPEGASGTVTLTLTAEALEGCANVSDSVSFLFIPPPSGNLAEVPDGLCENSTFTFTSEDEGFNGYFTFEWSLVDEEGAEAGTIEGPTNEASVTFNLNSFSEEDVLTLTIQADLNGECQVSAVHEFGVLAEPEICDFFELAGNVIGVNPCTENSEEHFFQWGCGETLLEGETDNYLVYTPYTDDCDDFWVSVSLYENGDCPVFAGDNFPTNVDDAAISSEVILFPNPASSELNVKFSTAHLSTLLQYSIFDLSGKLIAEGTLRIHEGRMQIDISKVPTGSHVLSLRGTDFTFNKPFVVLKQ